jgi:pyruvate dehydrogenase E1 component beta subunit
MFGGQRAFPLVFRAPCGGGERMAAQHSQSPYSIYAHVPGLKVIVPSNPADAMGLMTAAIVDDNPVICLEPARLTMVEGEVDPDLTVPLGQADIKRTGTDVTVVAVGYMVTLALEAADILRDEGISVEVVDPRTVSPLDADALRESVRRTTRLVVADEAPPMCSMAAEVAASVTEDPETFASLAAPPVRVCGLPVPIPYSAPLEDHVLPDAQAIVEAVRKITR